jgi:hypothetical protein
MPSATPKAAKTSPKHSQKVQKDQLERFRQAAREHECELDEAAFDEALKKVFPPKEPSGNTE